VSSEAIPCDPFKLDPEEIATRVAAAGIVGMGGATFPSAVKLNLRTRYTLKTLVINGAECEPYLTCDDRLMQEHTAEVIDGIRIMAHALGVEKIIIGIENNKPDAQLAMETEALNYPEVSIARLPTRYPMGSEKHLVQTLTGLETPARGLTADIGVVVHNVATALAVHDALRHGRPLLSRVVTVSGGAVREPKNLRVLIGTPVDDLLSYCGGFTSTPARLISGGPMMGQILPSTRVPVVKGSNGVLALTGKEMASDTPMPCIRCASCVRACPCGLVPLEMANFARAGDLEGSVGFGLMDCIACGSCAYVCPSNIPLVQYFNYAKGELTARQRTEHKQLETKRLAELRSDRIEKQKQAKREALAKRKQAAKAQQQEAAEAEA
jgi:electron transport complex protein RnfC